MLQKNPQQPEPTRMLAQVLGDIFDSLLENQERIIALMGSQKVDGETIKPIGEYLTEQDAKKLLERGTTWFWNMRTKGKLGFSKIGNKIFYKKSDIEGLLHANHKEGFRKC
ncbi:MAG: hypothetical protein ACI81T_002815 [Bacteroidia bacterium]|jgi:hypothetical protein